MPGIKKQKVALYITHNKPIKCGTAKAWLSFAPLHSLAKHLPAPYWGVMCFYLLRKNSVVFVLSLSLNLVFLVWCVIFAKHV